MTDERHERAWRLLRDRSRIIVWLEHRKVAKEYFNEPYSCQSFLLMTNGDLPRLEPLDCFMTGGEDKYKRWLARRRLYLSGIEKVLMDALKGKLPGVEVLNKQWFSTKKGGRFTLVDALDHELGYAWKLNEDLFRKHRKLEEEEFRKVVRQEFEERARLVQESNKGEGKM